MNQTGPILDLASLTLEATSLDRAEVFYGSVVGLEATRRDDDAGVLEFRFSSGQDLRFWRPTTGRHNDPRLASLGARGGTHVHWAMQIPFGSRGTAKRTLDAHGVVWQEIDLGDGDFGLYFFDPFGHGLELREVMTDPNDRHSPVVPLGLPAQPSGAAPCLPVLGLREVALAFEDYPEMLRRLPAAYGLPLAKEQPDRAFAQFTLGPSTEPDGRHTPRRWLYAWDPQVGLAGMLGGEHAVVGFYADVDAVAPLVQSAALAFLRDGRGLAVRDPAGHVFEFVPLGDSI